MKIILLTMALGILSLGLQAQNNPVSLSSDRRIKEVVYLENDVVPVEGVSFTTTQIQFANKEEVRAIEGGDTAAWMVTYHSEIPALSNSIFLKPTLLSSNTNMTVVTNQHVYYFHLINSKQLNSNPEQPIYALKFTYPMAKALKSVSRVIQKKCTAQRPKLINTAYRFSGSPQLVPRHVFDDGKFTYFELSPAGAVPAIFAVDGLSGKESTVNIRREGKTLVVQRLAPQFTLRLGGLATSVFNIQAISRIVANRRPK